MTIQDWIKAVVAVIMVDVSKGTNIFPRTPTGTMYSTYYGGFGKGYGNQVRRKIYGGAK